ncbi:MAG: TlpA disulfide reductase family protein [Ghiorsea sp.]
MKYIFVLLSFMLLMPVVSHSVEYQWKDAKGEQVSLDAYKGKPVLLHFWASWCPPCRAEMPAMSKWAEAHPEVQVVMISLDSDQADAEAFYQNKHIQAPLNMGDMGQTSNLGVRGLPTTVIIDEKSDISRRHLGDIEWNIEAVSQQVLGWL